MPEIGQRKNCINCKWDSLTPQGDRMIQCGQGHARTFKKIIEDCHAWEEKLKLCWCELWRFPEVINLTDSGNYTFKPKFCPECGKKLEAI